MAIIKQASEAPETPDPEEKKNKVSEGEHRSAQTFEEVQKIKAKLFHSKKEAFDIWGIKNHLLIIFLVVIALVVCAFFPLITTVEDPQALVVPANLVTVEALKEGKITDVFIHGGEVAEKGRVIARIVNPQDASEVSDFKSQSRLIEAELRVLDAKRIYWFERFHEDKELHEKKVIARDEFLKTELTVRTLEQERQVLEIRLNTLAEKLLQLEEAKKRGLVTARVAGKVISDIQEKHGTFVTKGEFLLTLASPEQRLEFFLAEEDHGRVDVGDPAKIKFYPLPNKTFRGRVVALKHYAQPIDKHGFKKNFIKVLIDVESFPDGIRNGMTAKVRIKGRRVSLLNGIQRRI